MKIASFFKSIFEDKEWLCLKIPFIYFWIGFFRICLYKGYTTPIPEGICKLINCNLFLDGVGPNITITLAFMLSIAYVLEFKMKWITLGLFLLSVMVFTIEESNAIFNRNGTFSFLFLAQSFAYWFNESNSTKLKYSRIQYSIQAVAVGYFLSACSKLIDSGLSWATDGYRITLQVLKSFNYEYYNNLDYSKIIKSTEVVQFLNGAQDILIILLSVSLILEFFALTAAINKKYARFYGVALLAMHLGIFYFMDILIFSFIFPMVIVLINPFFLIVRLIQIIIKKLGIHSMLKIS